MRFENNGVSLEVPDQVIAAFALGALFDEVFASTSATDVSAPEGALRPPRIGAAWPEQGGIYAGVTRGVDGGTDQYLIVGPDLGSAASWSKMMERAKEASEHGFSDFRLPTRKEQALCFANVPELFEPESYWSGEQHADDGDYAWYQNFNYGNQHNWNKSNRLRARAVRSLPVS